MSKNETLLLIDYILSGLNAVYKKQEKGVFEAEYLKTKLRRFAQHISTKNSPEDFLEALENITTEDLQKYTWSA